MKTIATLLASLIALAALASCVGPNPNEHVSVEELEKNRYRSLVVGPQASELARTQAFAATRNKQPTVIAVHSIGGDVATSRAVWGSAKPVIVLND
jgi:hypothetical protein